MISTESKYGAACAAKRIISTARDAEVRGDEHADRRVVRQQRLTLVEALVVEPGRADDAVQALRRCTSAGCP